MRYFFRANPRLHRGQEATAETALASAFGDGGALILDIGEETEPPFLPFFFRSPGLFTGATGAPPLCGVPGRLLGLFGAGGVEHTVPGRFALGTGGVISFRSGERTPVAGGTTSRGAGRSTDTGLWPLLANSQFV